MDEQVVDRFLLPPGRSFGPVIRALVRAGYTAERIPAVRLEALYRDTQGGRLRSAGARLSLERAGGRSWWRWVPPSGPPAEPWPPAPGCPTQDSVEAGDPPSEAAACSGGRKLYSVAGVTISREDATLTAPSGARLLVVRETLFRIRAPYAGLWKKSSRRLLTVRGIEGDPAEIGHLSVYLRDRLGLIPEDGDICALALEAMDRVEPGGWAPVRTRVLPEDCLPVVARKVLRQQVLKLRANLEGTLLDLDPEYLHDSRVATRRLRSALKLFASALGARRAESLRRELGWVGQALGGVRDLDVFIANLEGHAGRLGVAARIASALQSELKAQRDPAREVLVATLESKRFSALLRRLDALVQSPVPLRLRGEAGRPASEAGTLFVRRAYRRVLKPGRAAILAPEPTTLHRLRILFKRLRYTSEFFAPAMGDRLGAMIGAMVKFQDCLGDHQDAIVAGARIEALAREMAGRGALPVESLLDLGALIQVQREIASDRRAILKDLWGKFDRGSVRRALEGIPPARRETAGL